MSVPANLEKVDLGHGVWMHKVSGGIIVGHTHDDGEECCGSVLFDVESNKKIKEFGRPLWTVESEDPLTLFPSIQSVDCSLHGFIREGKWIPA